MKRITLALALLASMISSVFAIDVPALSGPVNDYANIFSPSDRTSLANELLLKEKETSNQIVILTVNELGNEDIKAFANQVFNAWHLGQKGKNNGILLVSAMRDRTCWIEVGYGLEGVLNDGKVGEILDTHFVPLVKRERYFEAFQGTTNAIYQVTRGEYRPPTPEPGAREPSDLEEFLIAIGFIALLFFAIQLFFLLQPLDEIVARLVSGALCSFVSYWLVRWGWQDSATSVIVAIIGFVCGFFIDVVVKAMANSRGGNSCSGGSRGGGGGSGSYSGGGGSSGGGGAGRSW